MATMTMNKAIHSAVRRDLGRFLEASDQFPDGDLARARALGLAWDNFDAQLTHHHEGEHAIAWPAFLAIGLTQAQLDGFDAEHEAMAAALAGARTAMTRFRTSGSAADAASFHATVAELQRVTETHLAHEEAETEQIMLENLDHPAVQEMGKKFGKVSPAVGGTFFAWVTDGADPESQAAIENAVPKPVLVLIGGIFGRRYRRTVAPVWAGR